MRDEETDKPRDPYYTPDAPAWTGPATPAIDTDEKEEIDPEVERETKRRRDRKAGEYDADDADEIEDRYGANLDGFVFPGHHTDGWIGPDE